jgi:hypothetical protein
MDLLKMPGNLGSVRGSLLTLHHYDWPAYPIGDDYFETLLSLSMFPVGTRLVEIDNGNGTILFAAEIANLVKGDLYCDKNFHICSWHSDLLEMKSLGLIEGVAEANEYEFHLDRWTKMVEATGTDKIYYEVEGEKIEIYPPVPDEDRESEFHTLDFAIVPSSRVRLTCLGLEHVRERIGKLQDTYVEEISPVVADLFRNGFFEPSVRQAVVTLEDAIKRHLASNQFGEKLGKEFISYLRDESNILESSIRTYSQELRMVFKFIRNVFAHNILEVGRIDSAVLLLRIRRVISMVSMISLGKTTG